MTFADLAASATKEKDFAKEKKDSATPAEEDEGEDDAENVDVEAAPDVNYVPIVKLEAVVTKTLEEEEEELFKMRAKMFRFEKDTNEWKERGTGEVRLLRNPSSSKVRLVMRRDQTLKVCANHLVSLDINLRPNVGSDRSWVYNVMADISDSEPKPETFAIRFANPENANAFKAKFEECQNFDGIEKCVTENKEAEEEKCKNESAKTDKVCKEQDEAVDEVQKSMESVGISDTSKKCDN